jgi:hypothetical protein
MTLSTTAAVVRAAGKPFADIQTAADDIHAGRTVKPVLRFNNQVS